MDLVSNANHGETYCWKSIPLEEKKYWTLEMPCMCCCFSIFISNNNSQFYNAKFKILRVNLSLKHLQYLIGSTNHIVSIMVTCLIENIHTLLQMLTLIEFVLAWPVQNLKNNLNWAVTCITSLALNLISFS